GLLFISCVLVDYAPQFTQIVLQNGFSGIEHHGPVHGDGNRRQYPEDRDDDHQLEKSKTVSLWERGARQKRAGRGFRDLKNPIWGLLFISCVLVDYAPQFTQIVLQNGFSGIEHHGPVHGDGNRRQYPEDRDDDHQLEKSKTVSLWERGARQKRAG